MKNGDEGEQYFCYTNFHCSEKQRCRLLATSHLLIAIKLQSSEANIFACDAVAQMHHTAETRFTSRRGRVPETLHAD